MCLLRPELRPPVTMAPKLTTARVRQVSGATFIFHRSPCQNGHDGSIPCRSKRPAPPPGLRGQNIHSKAGAVGSASCGGWGCLHRLHLQKAPGCDRDFRAGQRHGKVLEFFPSKVKLVQLSLQRGCTPRVFFFYPSIPRVSPSESVHFVSGFVVLPLIKIDMNLFLATIEE